jgi:hypothetical protein
LEAALLSRACLPAAGGALHQRGSPRGNAASRNVLPATHKPTPALFPSRPGALHPVPSPPPPPHGKTPASPARAVAVVNAQIVAGKDDTQQRHGAPRRPPMHMHQRYGRSQRLAYRRFGPVAEPAAPSGLLLWARRSSSRWAANRILCAINYRTLQRIAAGIQDGLRGTVGGGRPFVTTGLPWG